MSELTALVKGVLVDLDGAGAGALADALNEAGREREAVLLRKRWKGWKSARTGARERLSLAWRGLMRQMSPDGAAQADRDLTRRIQVNADTAFANYIRTRFGGVRVEEVPMWLHHIGGIGHAVCNEDSGAVYTACRSMFIGGGEVSARRPARICAACRKGLTAMSLTPRSADGATEDGRAR